MRAMTVQPDMQRCRLSGKRAKEGDHEEDSCRVVAAAALPIAVAGAAVSTTVVVDLDPALGELPEGVAVDKRGDVFFSVSPLGQVRKLDRDGSVSLLAQVVPPGSGNGTIGMAIDAPGNVYVATATFDPATSGVYKIARDGSFARLPGTGAITFPNGIALDKNGNVYVTDTIGGAVWRVPANGGSATKWFESPLLLGDGSFNFGFRSARTASPIASARSSWVTPKRRGSCASRSTLMAARALPRSSRRVPHCSQSTASRSTSTGTSWHA